MLLDAPLQDLDHPVLAELDDHRLVAWAAAEIGVPRRDVPGDRSSFVLHAPLELLARAALLPHVAAADRGTARRRVASLVAGYVATGNPLGDPSVEEHPSMEACEAVLAAAISAGDGPRVDSAAAWLGARARPSDLVRLLSPTSVDRLGAAGHGNIYLALLARTQPRGLPGQMLRHPMAALALDPARRIDVPDAVLSADPSGRPGRPVLDVLREIEPIGPPPSRSIASMVEHAAAAGVFDALVEVDLDGPAADVRVLRFAAQAMLQGPSDQAPYGWTHCLTLAQAALMLGADAPDIVGVRRARYVAAAYLAAHWAASGEGTVDLDHVPEHTTTDLRDALFGAPELAAAAAWHAPDTSATAALLASTASVNHDAHRVKYTLACLDAGAADPAARRLHLAAAAYLHAWWHAHPDTTDPLA